MSHKASRSWRGAINLGLAALADVAGLKRRPDVYALGFMLGPRLNAAGRIGHADDALGLLMETHKGEAHTAPAALDEMNRQRQSIEMRVVEDAKAQAEAAMGKERNRQSSSRPPKAGTPASSGWRRRG